VGYAAALGHSPRVGLGTDGYPAAMADERAALAEREDEDTVTRRSVGAAQMAGELFGLPLGTLAPGAGADLVVERDGAVAHVVVGGRVVVRDGRLLGGDIDEIRAEAHAEAERLWSRMAALPSD
jgi:hypothetical protein